MPKTDLSSRFDTIPACDRRTDTWWQQTPRYICTASRGKNGGELGLTSQRSSATSPFNRAHATSYSTDRNYRSILYRFRDRAYSELFVEKSPNFPSPPTFGAPWGWLRWNFVKIIGVRKLESLSCSGVCLILRSVVFIQYQFVTDRRTDTQRQHIAHKHSSRGKNRLRWQHRLKTLLFHKSLSP